MRGHWTARRLASLERRYGDRLGRRCRSADMRICREWSAIRGAAAMPVGRSPGLTLTRSTRCGRRGRQYICTSATAMFCNGATHVAISHWIDPDAPCRDDAPACPCRRVRC
jgi:hypothetical protein